MLCCLSKIIERVTFNHIYSFLIKEGLLHKFQSGFRHLHSTTTALLHLINTIYTDMDNSSLTGALFLDLRKAFDTVNHTIMLAKIKALNPDEQLLNWFTSYLENRTQVVDFDGKHSKPATIKTGVPQGSILGPLLFLLYVNDLPSLIESQTIMFADDTTVLSHGSSHQVVTSTIQRDLDSICLYSSRNHLVPHPKKTKVILFSKPSQATPLEERSPLSLNNVGTEYVTSYKCLGFTLDQHLDYSLHLKDMCRKINYGLQIMRRVNVYLPKENLILLANSLVLSHLDYCSPILYNLNCGQLDILLKLQKQCARIIFGYDRRTHSKPLFIQLNWLPLHQRIEYNICLLLYKVNNNIAPPYLSEMFVKTAEVHQHRTRAAVNSHFFKIRGTGHTYLKSFRYYGAKVWNLLPTEIRHTESIENFKIKCKAYFMDKIKSDSYVKYDWSFH